MTSKIMLTQPESNVNPATEAVTDWLLAIVAEKAPETEPMRTGWGRFALDATDGRTFSVSVEEV